MPFILIRNACFALMFVALSWPLAALGQEDAEGGDSTEMPAIPKEGSYSSTVESVGRYRQAGIGEGIQAALYEWTIEIKNDAGKGFLHGAVGECVGVTLMEGDVNDQVGYCTITDQDGDQMFETFNMKGFIGEGSGHALAGTGKYEGIETSHKFWFEALDATGGDAVESESRRVGTYRFMD